MKCLATQTARATVEIGEHIGGIQAATTDSVAAIAEIGVIIGRISETAMTVVDAVGKQDTTSKGIALNVQKAAASTIQVAASPGEVTRGAKETGGASMQVPTSAELLSTESSRLKHALETFLSMIQAA